MRERRYVGTVAGWMPSEEAKAAFLPGCAESTRICFSTSQLATLAVPPYSSGEAPLTLRVAVVPVADGAFDSGFVPVVGPVVAGAGLSGGAVASLAAVDSVKGSGPDAAAGCRKTSLPAEVVVPPPPPLGLVSTTARVTAAARATIVVASRGTERHQGLCGGSGGPGAPRSRILREGPAAGVAGGLPGPRTGARKADPWDARTKTTAAARAAVTAVSATAAAGRRVEWSRALLPRRRGSGPLWTFRCGPFGRCSRCSVDVPLWNFRGSSAEISGCGALLATIVCAVRVVAASGAAYGGRVSPTTAPAARAWRDALVAVLAGFAVMAIVASAGLALAGAGSLPDGAFPHVVAAVVLMAAGGSVDVTGGAGFLAGADASLSLLPSPSAWPAR